MTAHGATGVALAVAVLVAAPAAASGTARANIYVPRNGPGTSCTRVFPLTRTVTPPAVLTASMRMLVRGPTSAERRAGYGGWFSSRTARVVRSVRIERGTAYVDFRNFSRLIPNASSSCGSNLLLAQLDHTALQFASVRRTVYSFDGSRRTFYEWLQLGTP